MNLTVVSAPAWMPPPLPTAVLLLIVELSMRSDPAPATASPPPCPLAWLPAIRLYKIRSTPSLAIPPPTLPSVNVARLLSTVLARRVKILGAGLDGDRPAVAGRDVGRPREQVGAAGLGVAAREADAGDRDRAVAHVQQPRLVVAVDDRRACSPTDDRHLLGIRLQLTARERVRRAAEPDRDLRLGDDGRPPAACSRPCVQAPSSWSWVVVTIT